MRYFFVFVLTLFYLFLVLFYPNYFKEATYDVCNLFIKIIIPSIIPMYIISSLIVNNIFFINLSNRILKRFKLFESPNSASLLFCSMLVGNPTTAILAINKYKNNEISFNDLNNILSTSFMNPLFIINSFNNFQLDINIAFLYILVSFLSNIFLLCKKYNNNNLDYNLTSSETIYDCINSISSLLLNIFTITLLINFIKAPLKLVSSNNTIIMFLFDSLEITTGIYSIIKYNVNSSLKFILLSILFSLNGFSIIYQILFFLKQKVSVKYRHLKNNYIINKFKYMILNNTLFIILFKLLF